MAPRWSRVARGGAVAAFATLVAALSHTLGGGTPPGVLAIALSMAFSVILCIAVAGRRLTLARTTVAVAAAQFALHTLYSVQGGATARTVDEAGHHHQAAFVPAESSAPVAVDVAMLLAHLCAAAITVAAIRYGDRAVRLVVRLARLAASSLLRALPQPAIPVLARPRPTIGRPARRLTGVQVLSAMRHRGPPSVLAAA